MMSGALGIRIILRGIRRDLWSMRYRLGALALMSAAGFGVFVGIYSSVDSLYASRSAYHEAGNIADLEIRFVPEEDSSVRIALYDARGRKVRSVFTGEKAIGTHTVRFDGLDDAGNTVASGIYFVRLTAEDGRTSHKRLVVVQ